MTLRSPDVVPDEDVRAAALQYVRKISGYRAPSEANRATFDRAVDDIARSTRALLDGLVSGRPGRRSAGRRDAGPAPGRAPARRWRAVRACPGAAMMSNP